jgi:predicted RNase H-like HicB family nuclease
LKLTIEIQNKDGVWTSEVAELPGVQASGQTRNEAIAKVQASALRALADRSENGQTVPDVIWQWNDQEIHERSRVVQRIDALRSQFFSIYGEMPDSTSLIQEDRARCG